MSNYTSPMNDLQAMRAHSLSTHSQEVLAHFGMIPPLLQTQEEMRGYLSGRGSNSEFLEFNGQTVLYSANPYSTWFLYPFLYVAMGPNRDDYRVAPCIPKTAFKSAKMMQVSQHFYDSMARELRTRPVEVVPPVIDVLVKWEDEVMVSTLGASSDPQVVEAAGCTWRVGHGDGNVPVTLPKEVEVEVTPAVLPRWVSRDFTDPLFYKDEAYAYVQRSHCDMARAIVSSLPRDTYLIVPGDGSGLFAGLFPGPGVFGDPIVTPSSNPRVVKERAEETIARAVPGALKPLVICSYVSVFFDCNTRGYPSLWIDTPYVMDRVPGLLPITEALYSKGIDFHLPVMLDRPHRRRPHQYHVPYLMNLLQLKSFRLSVMSQAASIALRSGPCAVWGLPQYSNYVRSSGSKFSVNSSPWLCPNVASMSDEAGRSRGTSYFIPLGNFQDLGKVTAWDGYSVLTSRRLYTIDRSLLHLLPTSCYVETVEPNVYFAIRDDVSGADRESRIGLNFSKGRIPVQVDSRDDKPPELDLDGDYQEDCSDSESLVFEEDFVSPHSLKVSHVRSILMERPLGSRQLRAAIQLRFPDLVFSREDLLFILKGDRRFRMGPNYWSVSTG